MCFISNIAEARIAEAMRRGEFDNLAGAGKPLALDDDRGVPEELRVAYRILKNAGCLPRELELRREIADVRTLLAATADEQRRARSEAAELSPGAARGGAWPAPPPHPSPIEGGGC